MARFLRSRWMRWALRKRAAFTCPRCGTDLAKSFHADHIIAFSRGGRTNIYDMQALCPACNLKKGNRDE